MLKHLPKTRALAIVLAVLLCLLPCLALLFSQPWQEASGQATQQITQQQTTAQSDVTTQNTQEESTMTSTAEPEITVSSGQTVAPTTEPELTDTPDVTATPAAVSTVKPETTATPVVEPEQQAKVPQYEKLMRNLDSFPISFSYNGVSYNGFKGFKVKSSQSNEVDRGTKTVQLLRHPDIPATFRLESAVYPQESAYEYAVYIINDGNKNTGTFSDLFYTVDFVGENPIISGIKGDSANKYYAPYEHDLNARTNYLDRSVTGRPSHDTFPYYNLSYGNGGTFIAIGWPGTWFANYDYNKSAKTTTLTCGQGGQGAVSTYVKPGETLRMPLMGFVEYQGLTKDEQTNAWRRYYINDVMRKLDGELTPTYYCVVDSFAKESSQIVESKLTSYKAHGIYPDAIWMDAGWYSGANGETIDWAKTGTLDIDYNRFPDGMKGIGDFAKENDIMFLLWFEPENMRLDTDAFLKGQPDFKKEWLLSTVAKGTWLESRIINIGDPECRDWMFKKICKVIDQTGATAYRQDFNNDPAPAWKECDAADPTRKGMTENQYVQGYLALWDALIEKYGFLIDSCASGGGRNDLESMKRAVPLHYSDWNDGYPKDYNRKSEMTQVLYNWFPYFKNGTSIESLYHYRMNYAPFTNVRVENPLGKDTSWELIKQGQQEYNLIRDYFYGNYYMLTTPSARADRWDGRMFYCPDKGEGFALLACLETSTKLTNTVCLKGLEADKQYTVKDLDGLVNVTASGKQLMEKGITVTVPDNPYAAILLIKRA